MKAEYSSNELDALIKSLSGVADELQQELRLAEISFDALGLNMSAEIPLDPSFENMSVLGFHRKGDEPQFYIRSLNSEERPLSTCSLKIRVAAAKRLSALFRALVDTSTDRIEAVREAIATTRAFNKHLQTLIKDDDGTRR